MTTGHCDAAGSKAPGAGLLLREARFDFVFVDEDGFKKYRPASFKGLVQAFREYHE